MRFVHTHVIKDTRGIVEECCLKDYIEGYICVISGELHILVDVNVQ